MRRINVKAFFVLVCGTTLLLALVFLIHWLQTGRIAQALLQRANRAEQEGSAEKTIRFLSRYLELVPDDLEARARLGDKLADDKVPVSLRSRARALFLLEQVLAKTPQRHELRLKLVRVALLLERHDLAREHLTYLTRERPNDPEAALLFGRLEEAESRWDQAIHWYRLAVRHGSAHIEAFTRLADVLRRHASRPEQQAQNAAEADQLMEALVTHNPRSYQAYLARWHYRQQWDHLTEQSKLEDAASDVRRALELAPEQIEVLLAAAELAQLQQQADEARRHLAKAQQLYPQDPRSYRERAYLELHEKNVDAALHSLRAGIAVLKGQARFELLWMLANIHIDRGQTAEAQAVLADMSAGAASPGAADYLQARLHVLDGNWSQAVKLLERSRALFTGSPELAKQADLLLAHCYEKLNNPEGRLAAFQRMASDDPSATFALLGKASALTALGQYEEALAQYQQVLKQPNAPASVWIELARLIVLRNLQAAQPDWKQADQVLQQAAERNPDAVEIPLLRAEMLVAQSKKNKSASSAAQVQQAQDILQAARERYPRRPEVWAALAALAEVRKEPAQALQLLQTAEKELGDVVQLRQAQVQLWVRRGGAEAKEALNRLGQNLESFSEEEQVFLLADLAEAHARLGNLTEAEQLWQRLAASPRGKNDPRWRLLLFEVAQLSGRETTMQQAIADLQRIEGSDGVLWRYCSAVHLLRQARQGERARLDEARRLLDAVAGKRAAWPAVYIARADLEDLAGHPDQAIANYRRALELGERSPRVVRLLVQQLYRQQRFAEAEQELQKLQRQAPSNDVKRLIVDIALRRQDTERAVQQALDVVAADSADYRDHLWLGQVLSDSPEHVVQAEQHLRQAVQLAPEQPETWLSLVYFLARTHQTQRAEEVIRQAQTQLPADKADLPLALAYEALGRIEQAQTFYQKALAAKPTDIHTLRGVAAFYLRIGQLDRAEPLLRKLMQPQSQATPADVGWARRGLALALAGTGDYRRFLEALALLGLQPDATGKLVEDPRHRVDDPTDELRARVRVLGKQFYRREMRHKAIALLEDLSKRQTLAEDDQFWLAQFYDADGRWPKARELLRQLTVHGRHPIHLAYYARAALRAHDLVEARRCIAQLEHLEKERKLEAGVLGSVELRAQLLEAQGDIQKAIDLLVDYATQTPAGPERAFLLIQTLARHKRYNQALEVCHRIRASHPPEKVAGATVSVLRAAQASAEQCQEPAAWIKEQMAKDSHSTLLPLHLADLEDLCGRYDEAERLYREVLQRNPNNVVALNNLAWFLAQKPERAAEGLTFINRALELLGPVPDVLDTRATVYLAMKRTDLAIADLEAANAERPAPVRYFHLAQAHRQANNAQTAASLLKKATTAGLKAEHLHPVERPAFAQMLRELELR